MRRIVPLVAVVGLGIAGCGSSSTPKSQPAATTASGSQSTATTKAPSFSGSGSSNYCTLARQVESSSKLQAGTDLKSTFANFDSLAGRFLSVVPSAIKSDAQTLVDAEKHLEQVLKAANYDFTKVNQADLQSFQDPKVTAAAAHIAAYDQQVCGITTTTG